MDKCIITGCGGKYHSRAYCNRHYQQARKGKIKFTAYYRLDFTGLRKRHPLRTIYHGMLDRCNNPSSQHYPSYGGRGIKVCERWRGAKGFSNFVADMGERPLGNSIDRIDNDDGYKPSNCRWADRSTQAYNKRTYATNKSGYRGVSYVKQRRYWKACITKDSKKIHLYSGPDKEMAALRYDMGAIQLWGDEAKLNLL